MCNERDDPQCVGPRGAVADDAGMFYRVMERLQKAVATVTKLTEEQTRLRGENAFLRSNIKDLETRNRELVQSRVKLTFSERSDDRTLRFHLAIDSLAIMYARDPRMIVEQAFRRFNDEFGNFFKKYGGRL